MQENDILNLKNKFKSSIISTPLIKGLIYGNL